MARTKCPPGILCITPSTIFFGVVILVLVCFIIYLIIKDSNKTTPISIQIPNHPIQQNPPVQVNVQKGDDRYTRAPKPLRNWLNPVDMDGTAVGSIPVIATRGLPEAYQSMGIVKTSDGKLLPLFGRRSISARERYNYYTRTDSYNPLPIPIEMQGRDCQDQVGCPELYNGDKVKMSATNEIGEVTIYKVRDILR
jgi:hypothetical protein